MPIIHPTPIPLPFFRGVSYVHSHHSMRCLLNTYFNSLIVLSLGYSKFSMLPDALASGLIIILINHNYSSAYAVPINSILSSFLNLLSHISHSTSSPILFTMTIILHALSALIVGDDVTCAALDKTEGCETLLHVGTNARRDIEKGI